MVSTIITIRNNYSTIFQTLDISYFTTKVEYYSEDTIIYLLVIIAFINYFD